MINQDDGRNHWQELAEQLGLEPEKPAKPAPAVRDIAPAPPAFPRHHLEDEPEELAAVPSDEESRSGHGARRLAPVETLQESEAMDAPLDTETEAGTRADGPEESRGSEGRGRRRRRRRSKPETETTPGETSDATTPANASESAADEDDAPRGRGRRRGRRGGEPDKRGRRVEAPVAEAVKAAPVPEPIDEDDGDLDDLSNWQAPSWQELIASLYRPER